MTKLDYGRTEAASNKFRNCSFFSGWKKRSFKRVARQLAQVFIGKGKCRLGELIFVIE